MKQVLSNNKLKKGKIDYIVETNTTIKKKKLSFSKQEITMPLHTLNDIINECQRIATEEMILSNFKCTIRCQRSKVFPI